MPIITKVDLSKPLEDFATARGDQLFAWAEKTWRGFLEQILQLMEGDDISDHDFTTICDRLARVHSAQHPIKHAEMLKDWATLAGFPLTNIKAWEVGKSLPAVAKREAIVRQMLERLVKHVRTLDVEAFLATMVHLANLKDLREPGTFVVVSPNTHRRSIHRLGLPQKISAILLDNGIKTLGDLKDFVKPPLPGGLIIGPSRRAPAKPPFSPKAKLLQLDGIDPESASTVMEVVGEWSGKMSPAPLYI